MEKDTFINLSTHERIEQITTEARNEMQQKVMDVFGRYADGHVEVFGSCGECRQPDFMSDLDMWVSIDDDKMDHILETRHQLYQAIGEPLITWEPRRFAPLDGVMSVVLFDTPSPVPLEVDMNIAPLSRLQQYEGYIRRGVLDDQFEWQQGEDDTALASRLDYTALVAMWATKYWYRGIDRQEKNDWARSRYDRLSAEVGLAELPKEHALGGTALFGAILDRLQAKAYKMGDDKRVMAYGKITETVEFVAALENERVTSFEETA